MYQRNEPRIGKEKQGTIDVAIQASDIGIQVEKEKGEMSANREKKDAL